MILKSKRKIIILLVIVTLILIGGLLVISKESKRNKNSMPGNNTKEQLEYKIDPGKLNRGCFGGHDCIPSIDSPVFESKQQAESWLEDEDLIFGVNHGGVTKAYPQRILNWHEIVNDRFGKDPVAVTFCPLCGTAVSFIRKVNGNETEFGVSGKLYNSDLIMYDRNEENYWQQATGEAIVGPASGRDEFLEPVSTITTTWGKWKSKHPDTKVLSRETGFDRDYDVYPYDTYEEDGEIYFSVQNSDARLHPKEVVYGIIVNDQPKAYKLLSIEAKGSFNDVVGGEGVQIDFNESGEIRFSNIDSGEEYIPLRGFWFAWVAFYPKTELFE
jgi:hypothetical protein